MKITLHYFRHGESTANVAQHTTCMGSVSHLLMLDPDLTESGKEQSTRASETAPHVDMVLSSELLRAIHTAARTYPKKTIHIVPHVKELGYGLDNVPLDFEYQMSYLNDYRHMIIRHDPDPECKTFMDYLRRHIVPKFAHRPEITLALFTHSRYMKKAFGLQSMRDIGNNGMLTKVFHMKHGR